VIPARGQLALAGLRPNPPGNELAVAFTLATAGPARLELLDVTGRRVRERALTGLRPGVTNLASLGARAALPPGVYLLRLSQGPRSVARKAALLR